MRQSLVKKIEGKFIRDLQGVRNRTTNHTAEHTPKPFGFMVPTTSGPEVHDSLKDQDATTREFFRNIMV